MCVLKLCVQLGQGPLRELGSHRPHCPEAPFVGGISPLAHREFEACLSGKLPDGSGRVLGLPKGLLCQDALTHEPAEDPAKA